MGLAIEQLRQMMYHEISNHREDVAVKKVVSTKTRQRASRRMNGVGQGEEKRRKGLHNLPINKWSMIFMPFYSSSFQCLNDFRNSAYSYRFS